MGEPVVHTPSQPVADRWHLLGLYSQKLAAGKADDFARLDGLVTALDGASVIGVLELNNPCIRLRRIARKAAMAPNPDEFRAALSPWADGVVALYAEHYGE